MLTFYKELDLGVSASGEWSSGRLGNLVFLSARPHVYKDKAESASYLHFEQLRLQQGIGLHCVPTLLAGSLDSGWRMVFRGDFAALAHTKFLNFEHFTALYPEFTFTFIGDNGQGDVMAAAMMKDKLGPRLEAVFIKLCQPLHLTPGYTVQAAREQWRSFHFFTTFVGAAVDAARIGLIHPTAVIRISSHAITRLVEMKDTLTLTTFDARRREMNADLLVANQYLLSLGLPVLPLIPTDSQYPLGASVWTPFGAGELVEFDPFNSIFRISLLHWTLRDNTHPVLYQHSSEVELMVAGQVGSRVWTPFGTGVLEAIRAPGSMHCIALTSWGWEGGRGGGAGYAKAYLQASECMEIVAGVGELVYCAPWGYGQVVRYRVEDGMYEVEMRLNGELTVGGDGSKDRGTVGGQGKGKKKAVRKGSGTTAGGSSGKDAEQHGAGRRCMLYTTGSSMRRIDEEEKKQRSCEIM